MDSYPEQLNKTISKADLDRKEVAEASRELSHFTRRLWLKNVPVAVNGVLKRRWRVRWNKLWEYSRSLAYGGFQPGMRVLDFGGGGTIPIFYLADLGCTVFSLDIDSKLTEHTNAVARQRGWQLEGSTEDLTQREPPRSWGPFDRIISFCVIEHIPKGSQLKTLARLSNLLKPGGMFELTFDYGETAPVSGAIRTTQEIQEMVNAAGLTLLGDRQFHDTGERFVLDKKYPTHRFTFGSLFLKKN
jgi:2-polyprenyl-3-methyl-5-hydroxy-6-metoxy-1,4-benzoquinol methylase